MILIGRAPRTAQMWRSAGKQTAQIRSIARCGKIRDPTPWNGWRQHCADRPILAGTPEICFSCFMHRLWPSKDRAALTKGKPTWILKYRKGELLWLRCLNANVYVNWLKYIHQQELLSWNGQSAASTVAHLPESRARIPRRRSTGRLDGGAPSWGVGSSGARWQCQNRNGL